MLAKLSLKDSELRYRRLFESAQDGILILDARTGMIEDVNPYLIKMLGYSREEFLEKKLWEVGAFKDVEASKDAFEALQDREYIRYEDLPLKAKDGRLIQVEFVSNVYLAGGEKIIQCNIRDITEHKRIIVALQANEKKYFGLLNQSSDGIFIIDLLGNIRTVNTAMCRELEFSQEEFLSMKIWDIFPKEYVDQYRERLTQILAGERFEEPGEYEVRGKDGKHHYVEILSTPHYSGRDIVGFQGIARDITGRRQLQEKLRQSEKKYRDLVEMTHDLVWAVDVEGRITYMSPASRSIYGREPEEMIGHLYTNFVAPDHANRGMAELASALATGAPTLQFENRVNHRDGHEVVLSANAQVQRDAAGNIVGMVGTSRDITAQKLAEEALQASEARNRNLIEHLPTVVYMNAVGDTSSTLYVSPQIETLLGYTPQEWLADPKSWSKTLHPEDSQHVLTRTKQTDFSNEPFEMEYRMIARDGRPVWVHDQIVLVKDPEGKPQFWQGIMLDITERKKGEAALRESESSLQGILRSTADGILAVSRENKTLFANERFIEMWHIPQAVLASEDDSLLLQHVLDQLSDPQAFLKKVQDLYRSKEESFDTVYFKDGRVFERLSHPLIREQVSHPQLQKTELRGRVWSFRDITHRKRAEAALRASEERLSQVWDATSDAMGLSDPEGIMLAANPAYLELYGYTREQVIGKSFSAIFPEESREQAVEQYRKVFASETIATRFESAIQRSDGTGRLVESNATFLTTNGLRTAMLSTIRDITVRKQAEKKILQQLQHLTALRTIDQVIASNFDLKLSLSEILNQVTMELDVDAAAILLLNPSLQMLEYGAERGFRTRNIKKLPMRLSSSYAGRVILERKSIQIQDPGDGQENLFLGTSLEGEDFVFYSCVPLITKGQIKGVLEVFHRSALEPDAEWLNFLHNLASQAAIAIENAVLFESLQRSNLELTLAYDATIEGWSRALDLRDKETEGHTQRVTEMTQKLARAMGVRESELLYIRWGTLLHDIGKMGIPDGILLKPAALSDEEWVMMKKHPVFAYEMLFPIRYLQQSLDIPYCHHEKWDGTGYPRGLKGEMIPLSARIFAVVDVWDALRSDRPYRAGWPEEKVSAHIRALSGTHFDPQVVDVFMRSLN